MGYSIVANRENVHYGIKNFIVDLLNDIKTLPASMPGSEVYCIENGVTYVKDPKGYWRIKKGVASGGDGGTDLSGDIIFDGGTPGSGISTDGEAIDMTQYHWIWDGGHAGSENSGSSEEEPETQNPADPQEP